MKKTLLICAGIAVLAVAAAALYILYGSSSKNSEAEVDIVGQTIEEDMARMDSVSPGYIFFESRVVLTAPFNELDTLDVAEVTNVFQVNVGDSTEIATTVYMFVHDMATGETNVDVHENAFITDDIELSMDEIRVPWSHAFKFARQSNYAPSTSKYITLRHGFGRYECNPFYTIGNEEHGRLWVDAVTGEVTDKDPSTIQK